METERGKGEGKSFELYDTLVVVMCKKIAQIFEISNECYYLMHVKQNMKQQFLLS